MPHISVTPHICSIYAAYTRHILVHISPNSAYFAPKRPAYFKQIFRYKPVSLNGQPQWQPWPISCLLQMALYATGTEQLCTKRLSIPIVRLLEVWLQLLWLYVLPAGWTSSHQKPIASNHASLFSVYMLSTSHFHTHMLPIIPHNMCIIFSFIIYSIVSNTDINNSCMYCQYQYLIPKYTETNTFINIYATASQMSIKSIS